MAENLFDGRKLRMLTALKGEDVVRVLNIIVRRRGKPQTIKSDNGGKFTSKAMDR